MGPSSEGVYWVTTNINITGNSDPGTSGILSPFSKIKGLYFNDENEPDNFMFEFRNDIERILKEKGVEYIDIKVDNKEDYYRIMNNLSNFNNDKIKMFWRTEDNYAMTIAAVEELDEENI